MDTSWDKPFCRPRPEAKKEMGKKILFGSVLFILMASIVNGFEIIYGSKGQHRMKRSVVSLGVVHYITSVRPIPLAKSSVLKAYSGTIYTIRVTSP